MTSRMMLSAARVVLLVATFLAFTHSPGAAQPPFPTGSIALRWNDCFGDGGASARNFACNTNQGAEDLVISAFPPAAIPQLVGAEIVITVASIGSTMPSWWQFQSGGCHSPNGLIFYPVAPSTASSCFDPWNFGAAGGLSFDYPFGGTGYARLRAVAAIPGSTSVPASTEVFVCRVQITHTKTVGTGSCGGCTSGMCLGLNSVVLSQPMGVGDFPMLAPVPGSASDVAGWQSDVAMSANYFSFHGGNWQKEFTSCSVPTAAQRPTWGSIKRLYR